jgi:hypothetical protein
MLLAERERLAREERRRGKQKETQSPTLSIECPPSPAVSIGQVMLSPTATFEFQALEDSDSDVDELTSLYLQLDPGSSVLDNTIDPAKLLAPVPGMPRHPDVQAYVTQKRTEPPSIPLPRSPHAQLLIDRLRDDPFAGMREDQNALAIFWRGEEPQTFGLITYNDPEQGQMAFPVEVMGRTTQVVEVPPYWTGRVQKLTGEPQDPATHCELTFDGFADMTFFRVSYVAGNNGPALIRTRSGRMTSGSPFRALNHVPNILCTHDSGGERVIKGHDNLFAPHRVQLQKFYTDFFEGPHQGQVDPGNNHALQMTHEKQLLCEFF